MYDAMALPRPVESRGHECLSGCLHTIVPVRVVRTPVRYDSGMEWLYASVPVRLRLPAGGRRALWTWRRRQDQAFKMAVEMALALEPDEPAPSRVTAWNRLTA